MALESFLQKVLQRNCNEYNDVPKEAWDMRGVIILVRSDEA